MKILMEFDTEDPSLDSFFFFFFFCCHVIFSNNGSSNEKVSSEKVVRSGPKPRNHLPHPPPLLRMALKVKGPIWLIKITNRGPKGVHCKVIGHSEQLLLKIFFYSKRCCMRKGHNGESKINKSC